MPKIIDHKQRKLELLNEFAKIFAEKGIEKARISDITVIKRSNFYQYYHTKQDVFEDILKNLDKINIDYRGEFMYKHKELLDEEIQEQMWLIMNSAFCKIGGLV